MKFSDFLKDVKGHKINDEVSNHFDELQNDNTLEVTVILSGQVALTQAFFDYQKFIEEGEYHEENKS